MKVNFLKIDKLEELLLANWTQFLDSSRLLSFVLETVRDEKENLAVVPASVKPSGVKIMISRFQLALDKFVVWVEFTVPIEDSLAFGTMELDLSYSGNISHVQTMGNLYTPG